MFRDPSLYEGFFFQLGFSGYVIIILDFALFETHGWAFITLKRELGFVDSSVLQIRVFTLHIKSCIEHLGCSCTLITLCCLSHPPRITFPIYSYVEIIRLHVNTSSEWRKHLIMSLKEISCILGSVMLSFPSSIQLLFFSLPSTKFSTFQHWTTEPTPLEIIKKKKGGKEWKMAGGLEELHGIKGEEILSVIQFSLKDGGS